MFEKCYKMVSASAYFIYDNITEFKMMTKNNVDYSRLVLNDDM